MLESRQTQDRPKWRVTMAQTALSPEEFILLTIEDDTEEAPWMVMGDPQITVASNMLLTLRAYARRRSLPWYVASMLPIRFTRPGTTVKGTLAPDLFVAFADDHPRRSFDIDEEGGFPPFVLEVLSPESTVRDMDLKVQAYESLGAREYALFAPTADLRQPPLQGFRRDVASGAFVRWQPDESGRLDSSVLDLWLVPRGTQLRLQERAGAILPTYGELEGRTEKLEGRNEKLEAEVTRLRDELARRPKA
jgi:Uma2 family endonuclease